MLIGKNFRTILLVSFVLWLWVGLAPAFAGTISGNVVNSSSDADARVYVKILNSFGELERYGTTIAAPGAFTINHNLSDGDYQLVAMMDVTGNGQLVTSMSRGQSSTFTVTGGIATGINVAMIDAVTIDPQNLIPQPPQMFMLVPGDGLVMVLWDLPRDTDSFIQAETLNLYWKANSAPGTTPGSYDGVITGIVPSDKPFAVVGGLANGTTYHFVMTGDIGGNPSISSFSDSVAAGEGLGTMVSGNLTINGGFTLSSATPAYVLLLEHSFSQLYIGELTDPSASTGFSLAGVQDGSYDLVAFVDLNNNGAYDLGEPNSFDAPGFTVNVNGGNLSGLAPVLTIDNSYAIVGTNHAIDDFGGNYYNVKLITKSGFRQLAGVTVSGGLLTNPIDIAGEGDGWFELWEYSPSRPVVGTGYTFDVTYTDGTTETLVSQVSAVLDDFPTPLAPIGDVADAIMPLLRWAGPSATMAGPLEYSVSIHGNGFYWDAWGLPTSQFSYAYDGSPLNQNNAYLWEVMVTDANENSAASRVNFTPIVASSITVSGGIEGSTGPLAGVTITEAGTGNSTVSNAAGLFSLPISSGSLFALEFSKAGYAPMTTKFMKSSASFDSGFWWLFSAAEFAAMNPPETGIVRSRVKDNSTGGNLAGATILASSSLAPGTTYQAQYFNGTDWSGSVTDASGKFRIKNIVDGDTVIVTGNLDGYAFTTTYYEVYAGQVAEGSVRGTPLPTPGIQGTVINGSSTPDSRIYLMLLDIMGNPTDFGTSIAAPGPFTIRTNLPDGNYLVWAGMDPFGYGVPSASLPQGLSNPVFLSGGLVTGADVILANATGPDTLAQAPPFTGVVAGDGLALVLWDSPTDMNEFAQAETFNVYWRAGGAPDPAGPYDGVIADIPVNDQNFCFVRGLANGTTYHFLVESVIGSSVAAGDVAVTTPAAELVASPTLSGLVGVSNSSTTGPNSPLYSILENIVTEELYIDATYDSSDGGDYAFHSLPAGTYQVLVFNDADNNGFFNHGDLNNFDGNSPVVVISGGDVILPEITINGLDYAFVNLGTTHLTDLTRSYDSYGLMFEVNPGSKRLAALAITSGLDQPIDIAIEVGGFFDLWWNNGSTRPRVNDSFTYEVTYTDGTTDIFTPQVSGVLDSFPTPTAPIGDTPGGTMPTFVWSAPNPAPVIPYVYDIDLYDGQGFWWDRYDLPSNQLSLAYDGMPLTENQQYYYHVSVFDDHGNAAAVQVAFTPIAEVTTPVAITAPNGGQTLTAGTSYDITWTAPTEATGFKLRYSTNGGTTWTLIDDQIGNQRSYIWTVPEVPFVKANCLIKVQAYNGGSFLDSDDSDAAFTINPLPLAITSPNGGEILVGTKTATINWTAPPAAESFKLRYSMNNGVNWKEIDLNVGNTNTYIWNLPDVPFLKPNCLVKVQAFNGAGVFLGSDVSDATFAISVAPTEVTSPNGGENWTGGTTQTITWGAPAKAVAFTLRYSPNNGANWFVIDDTIGNVRSYQWTLPTYASPKTTLIRIQAFNQGGWKVGEDDSDGSFIITVPSTPPPGGGGDPGGGGGDI